MLQFKKATERTEGLVNVGTIASLAGIGGSHELASAKNFKSDKRVSIKLTNKEGDYQYINCSTPVSAWLREANTEAELKTRLNGLAQMPIYELPQTNQETGEPVMVVNEETGEVEQLVLYAISFGAATDMSSTRVTITQEMLEAKQVAARELDFSELIAL
jgi:hypothetical protein